MISAVFYAFLLVFFNVVVAEMDWIEIGCSKYEETPESIDSAIEECATTVGLHHGIGYSLRRKRDSDFTYTPAERRIAGCVVHCVLGKFSVIGEDQLPTRYGIFNFLTNGINYPMGFTVAIKNFVDDCYRFVTHFKTTYASHQPTTGALCDVHFKTFDCIENKIEEMCSKE